MTSSSSSVPAPDDLKTEESCQSVSGEWLDGECKELVECPSLYHLLRHNDNRRQTLTLLNRLTCGYIDVSPLVCCQSTRTPNKKDSSIFPQLGFDESSGTDPTSTDQTNFQPEYQQEGSSQISSNQLPSPPYCGLPYSDLADRVIGGTDANLGSWPWMAAIGYRSSRYSTIQWWCGGALITNDFVLTAAHCLSPAGVTLDRVRLGDLDLDDNIRDGASPIEIKVVKKIPHENYRSNQEIHDVALLKLAYPVQFTELIKPICLPINDEVRSSSFEGWNAYVTGWGRTKYVAGSTKVTKSSHLQQALIPVINNDVCRTKYQRDKIQIYDSQMCAAVQDGSKDSCKGDSGGPLVTDIGNYFYLIGVVSFGIGCASPDYPGVYTRVTHYIDWIQKNIQ